MSSAGTISSLTTEGGVGGGIDTVRDTGADGRTGAAGRLELADCRTVATGGKDGIDGTTGADGETGGTTADPAGDAAGGRDRITLSAAGANTCGVIAWGVAAAGGTAPGVSFWERAETAGLIGGRDAGDATDAGFGLDRAGVNVPAGTAFGANSGVSPPAIDSSATGDGSKTTDSDGIPPDGVSCSDGTAPPARAANARATSSLFCCAIKIFRIDREKRLRCPASVLVPSLRHTEAIQVR